jgi:hypothetical protein
MAAIMTVWQHLDAATSADHLNDKVSLTLSGILVFLGAAA